MLRLSALAFLTAMFLLPMPPQAQEPSVEPLEIGPSGQDYLKTIRFRRIDANVGYYDPTRPPPPLDTRETPRRERGEAQANPERARWITLAVSGALLAVILIFAARIGGAVTLSLGGADDGGGPGGRRRRAAGRPLTAEPAELSSILAIADRRQALILLAQSALAKAAAANGLLLQRSWTARDALRRLSADATHIPALRALVHASELVHFGQRDISSEEFDSHVASIRPLFTGGAA